MLKEESRNCITSVGGMFVLWNKIFFIEVKKDVGRH